jgi:hypothetical protein
MRPVAVPGGTHTDQPAGPRRSFVASAPLGQRNVTRIPDRSRRPRSWIWRPTVTRTAVRQPGDVAGTQRTPVSRGAAVRASAPPIATSESTNTVAHAMTATRSLMNVPNRGARRE